MGILYWGLLFMAITAGIILFDEFTVSRKKKNRGGS